MLRFLLPILSIIVFQNQRQAEDQTGFESYITEVGESKQKVDNKDRVTERATQANKLKLGNRGNRVQDTWIEYKQEGIKIRGAYSSS